MEDHFLRFSIFTKYPNLINGISNRSYQDMCFGRLPDSEIIKNREYFFKDLKIEKRDVIVANLCHGNRIVAVSENEKGSGAEAYETGILDCDGLITREKGVYLMVTAADCLPVMFFDPINEIVAIVHAGWRGVISQIISAATDKFLNFGSDTSSLIVGVGPGICQKHFIVKKDVLEKFHDYYPSATLVRNHDGYVDLKKAVLIDLLNRGINRDNIEISENCTVCQNGIYGSYRKEGKLAPKAAAIIGIKK